MRTRLLVSFALCSALSLGCASSNYYDTFMRDSPSGYVELPDPGVGLHETLAGLYAPRRADFRLLNSKVAVLRVTETSAVEMSQPEISEALHARPAEGQHFGIVSMVNCTSRIDMKNYYGQRIQWMLLEDGRLSAWDLSTYGSRCAMGTLFRPAHRDSEALETQVRAFRDRVFPESMAFAAEQYTKGLAYLEAGRLQAAEEQLARGDGNFDPNEPHIVKFERPVSSVRPASDDETAMARAELVRGIRAVRNAREAGQL